MKKFHLLDTHYSLREKIKIKMHCKHIIHTLAKEIGERSMHALSNLKKAENFIFNYFQTYNGQPTRETILVHNHITSNIITEIKGSSHPENIIILGAHYDTVEGSCGANDNATGIAGLLETYRMLSLYKPIHTIRFIAFTLEEPPFFSTDTMGSMVHAKNCAQNNENIKLMISLDMLGYGSIFAKQKYPLSYMKHMFPSFGKFLTVVALPSSSQSAYLWKNIYNKSSKKNIYEVIAPASVNGITLSDHYSFSKYGYPAIMITDTGFYRNKNYHTELDTYKTINFRFLMENIMNIYVTLKEIANLPSL